ncbi:hypothetical protein TNCV_4853911 [Trichonephila clavipes]|nr:hypothetical protein TNCV_4853911 [Trichonephila clavipes]
MTYLAKGRRRDLLELARLARISKAKRRKRVTRDMSTLKNSMLELAAKFDDNYNTGLIKSFMFGLNKTEIKTMTDILSRYKFRDSHVPLTNHSSAIQTHQDIPAETVSKNNSVPVTTPSCHVRSANQDTLYQAGPITSGHICKLDMGWRNASRSVSQRRPASRNLALFDHLLCSHVAAAARSVCVFVLCRPCLLLVYVMPSLLDLYVFLCGCE